jgi:hypothetical protein
MKLLTKAIISKLPAIYSTEKIPTEEKIAIVKFFDPSGSWTWYAVEGSPEVTVGEHGEDVDDFMFFGYVKGHENEWGSFCLSQLQSVKGRFGLGIERDLYFKPTPMRDILNGTTY